MSSSRATRWRPGVALAFLAACGRTEPVEPARPELTVNPTDAGAYCRMGCPAGVPRAR